MPEKKINIDDLGSVALIIKTRTEDCVRIVEPSGIAVTQHKKDIYIARNNIVGEFDVTSVTLYREINPCLDRCPCDKIKIKNVSANTITLIDNQAFGDIPDMLLPGEMVVIKNEIDHKCKPVTVISVNRGPPLAEQFDVFVVNQPLVPPVMTIPAGFVKFDMKEIDSRAGIMLDPLDHSRIIFDIDLPQGESIALVGFILNPDAKFAIVFLNEIQIGIFNVVDLGLERSFSTEQVLTGPIKNGDVLQLLFTTLITLRTYSSEIPPTEKFLSLGIFG
ncbi:MAG: hypothetical protein Hyperionvirus5_81 [Hyperionvirus sp.]|uniref:Uncharacterized protein n=1 Tax=Hyperionvirus sp. TaxID=2487770 RepID=A0A3G5A7R6_9VIRU|nr:MAG: hypothetical protein Hyperionvirus5_81 [Hyperionvirus sp.]